MRWRAVVALVAAFVLLVGFGVPNVYAQSTEELRRSIEQMQQQLEAQQKRLQQLESEQTLQQKNTELTVRQAIARQVMELQPPVALLGPAAMPPSRFGLGIFGNVDFKWVRLRGVEVEFAGREQAPFTFSGTPIGDLETVDVDRVFAPRYTLGAYLPGGWGVVSGSWQSIAADGTNALTGDPSTSTGVAGPLPPACCGNSAFARATAKNRVTLDQFDFQYQYPIQVTRSFVLTPEVGVRAVWFTQSVRSDFYDTSGDLESTLDKKADSHGVGPKVATGATWEFMPGLSLSVKGAGGYLVGSTEAEHVFCRGGSFAFSGNCDRRFTQRVDTDQGFPFVEGEFALNYTFGANSPLRGLTVGGGYQVGTFFNLTTHSNIVNGASDLIIWQRRDVTHDAPFFKLQYVF